MGQRLWNFTSVSEPCSKNRRLNDGRIGEQYDRPFVETCHIRDLDPEAWPASQLQTASEQYLF
jgi:hypothetical protein